jgi:hypothetical protein
MCFAVVGALGGLCAAQHAQLFAGAAGSAFVGYAFGFDGELVRFGGALVGLSCGGSGELV